MSQHFTFEKKTFTLSYCNFCNVCFC